MGRRYDDLSGVLAYSARVAAAVGAMMCVLMGVRDRNALARACDLGLAMQLTNISRDVGEDARAGRLYLPREWLAEARVDEAEFLAAPAPGPEVCAVTERLLAVAERFYLRAEAGIAALPLDCRPGIFAARHCYAGIGGAVRRNGFDSVTRRARTTGRQKAGWLALSFLRAGVSAVMPKSAVRFAEPAAEVAFLVDAAASPPARASGRGEALLGVLAALEARDRERRAMVRLSPAE
jgi:phytoene synthase